MTQKTIFHEKEEISMGNKQVNVFYAKGMFKAGMAVGAGMVVGKYFGKLITGVVEATGKTVLEVMADHGIEWAQEACNKTGIKYGENDDSPTARKMGFDVV